MAQAGKLLKESMARELTVALGQWPNILVTSLGSLPAVEADTLRKQLLMVKARMLMVKRTIGVKVLSGLEGTGALSAGAGKLSELLAGSVVLILSGPDAGPVAKILSQFAKSNEGKLAVRGGWIEGRLLDAVGLAELASLAPKLQLIAQLIGALESPVTDLIFTIEAISSELVWVLEAASKTKVDAVEAQEGSQHA